METEPKPQRMWGWDTEQAPWEKTVAGVVISPVLDFVVRTGEIILLAGAFRAAAFATNNNPVEWIAKIMFVALGVHLGLGYARFVLIPLLTRPKKVTILKFVIAMAIAIGVPFLFRELVTQVNEAAKAIATSTEVTTV